MAEWLALLSSPSLLGWGVELGRGSISTSPREGARLEEEENGKWLTQWRGSFHCSNR